jgi:hypothetical protein
MDLLVIGGFLLGILGAKKELSSIVEKLKNRFSDYDKYFNTLENISQNTLKSHVKKKLNLSEDVSLIGIIENNILEGDAEKAKKNLSTLFHLSDSSLEIMLNDFKSKIIESKSMELVLALELKSIEKMHQLERQINDINKKINSNETDLKESLSNLLELLELIVEEGNLKEALDRISRINIDNLGGYDFYKEQIILIESDIILKSGLEESFTIQIRKLNSLKNSFKKYYYLLLLHRKTDQSKSFKFDKAFEEIDQIGYLEELKLLNTLIENNKIELTDNEIDNLHAEAKKIIIKQVLLNLINSNKPNRADELITNYKNHLEDKESKFYILINTFNRFHSAHPSKFLSKNEIKELDRLKSKLLNYESYYRDFMPKIKSSFYYNLAIALCRLKDISALNFYDYFKTDKNLTLGFIQFLLISDFLKEAMQLLESSSLKDSPEFLTEWMQLKLQLGQYSDLADLDYKDENLSTDSKSKILISKNIITYESKGDKFNENDIVLLENDKDNVIIYIYIARIFNRIKNINLTNKYFELAYKHIKYINPSEKLHLAETAKILMKFDIAKSLLEELFSVNPNSKLLYAEILRDETNDFNEPSIEVTKFFNSIKTSEINPIDIYRIKIEYLFNQGEKDRAIDVLEWIIDNFDDDVDWYHYISMLIDSGYFAKARDQLSLLSDKNKTPIILLAIGIIHLYTDTVSKLEKFTQNYLLAEKLSSAENKKLDESILRPVWFYIVKNGLHITPEPDFIKEDVFVRLKNKQSDEIIELCIHSDPNLAIPFEEEYLNCKHLHITDKLISDFKFKKGVALKLTSKSEKFLKQKKIPDEIINNLIQFKDQEIIGEQNYHNRLRDAVGEFSHVKSIPVIMESLEKEWDEVSINGESYLIILIDHLWNYPARYLNLYFYSHSEKFGMKTISAEPDPLVGILPELEKDYQSNKNLAQEYLKGNVSFFIFAHRNYEHYFGGILKLLTESNSYFLSGYGIDFSASSKFAISFCSILILSMFDKLKFISLDKVIVPESLILEIQRITKDVSDGIPIEQMSIALEDDSSLSRFVQGPDANRERARKWHSISEYLNVAESVDTIKFEDEYTPFVKIIGKLEVDSIRIATNLKIPLVIDDEFIHKILNGKNVTNLLPFYYQFSTENLADKLNFMNDLSKMGYRYVLFHDFIKLIIDFFLTNEGLVLGFNTPFGSFLNILKSELKVNYPYDVNLELFKGFKTILTKHLYKNSDTIFKEIWLILPKSIQDTIRFPLSYFLPDLQSERNFVLNCLKEVDS